MKAEEQYKKGMVQFVQN